MTTHTLPDMPEPTAWKFRRFLEFRETLEADQPSELDGEVTPLVELDAVRALRLATWNAALEAAAKACDERSGVVSLRDPDPYKLEASQCAAAIRSMKKDEE
jgi:hypothetical protein